MSFYTNYFIIFYLNTAIRYCKFLIDTSINSCISRAGGICMTRKHYASHSKESYFRVVQVTVFGGLPLFLLLSLKIITMCHYFSSYMS